MPDFRADNKRSHMERIRCFLPVPGSFWAGAGRAQCYPPGALPKRVQGSVGRARHVPSHRAEATQAALQRLLKKTTLLPFSDAWTRWGSL